MQSVLKSLKSECAEDVRLREQLSDALIPPKKTDVVLCWLVIFMFATTIIYMAWSISKINDMNHSINSIHNERNEADRKADLFLESVRSKKAKK